jgi:hypothetical protein
MKKIVTWVQMQQQRSLIMTMKNIVHKSIYDEQNYTSSNTKTQQFYDTSNKNNKSVLII